MKEIFGPYQSVPETIKMTEKLADSGYEPAHITILSNIDNPIDFEEKTEANVANSLSESSSWKSKMKQLFTNKADHHRDITDELAALEFSDDEIAQFIEKIVDGHFYVIADDNTEPDKDTVHDLKEARIREDLEHRNSYTTTRFF
ncbi:hypothetical protein JNUCC1_02414 [Lentibacillus sp. JNUCC-1]|uniref:general stress protein n=1 Tax=Lentibacillus sp. JNUCC-1 TaxID=2654513 RepID=UPI0012E8854C|nr:general stress protein [Lentibacillus sp. JNUCC-1]MUV38560.1 hypothetical protein [Lentibacillus sp. JNUCC-1]